MNTEHGNELKKGVESFNAWRKANPSFIPDLSNANLSRANLRNANLSRANLRNANLSYADLRWASLIGADLSNADLQGADLNYLDLSSAELNNATFSPSGFRYVATSGKVEMGNIEYTKETGSPDNIESVEVIIRVVRRLVTWLDQVYSYAIGAVVLIFLIFCCYVFYILMPSMLLFLVHRVIAWGFTLLGLDVPSWLKATGKILMWPLDILSVLSDILSVLSDRLTPPEYAQGIIAWIVIIIILLFEVLGSIATRSWLRLIIIIGLTVFLGYLSV
jgi:hypothetical protein